MLLPSQVIATIYAVIFAVMAMTQLIVFSVRPKTPRTQLWKAKFLALLSCTVASAYVYLSIVVSGDRAFFVNLNGWVEEWRSYVALIICEVVLVTLFVNPAIGLLAPPLLTYFFLYSLKTSTMAAEVWNSAVTAFSYIQAETTKQVVVVILLANLFGGWKLCKYVFYLAYWKSLVTTALVFVCASPAIPRWFLLPFYRDLQVTTIGNCVLIGFHMAVLYAEISRIWLLTPMMTITSIGLIHTFILGAVSFEHL